MGSCGSRSSPTTPVSVPTTTSEISNSDWLYYAPTEKKCCHCGQSQATYQRPSSWASNCWDFGLDASREEKIRSSCSSFVSSYSSIYGTGDYIGLTSHQSLPHPFTMRTRQQPGSLSTPQSRTYSLLSPPDFHSEGSHPRNNLVLNPELFSNTIMSPFTSSPDSDGRSVTHSIHNKPNPQCSTIHTLTLDPELFHTPTASPIAFPAHDRRNTANKLDTDCASRFSSASSVSSSSSSSPASEYPLTPLSVRTEPFPRPTCKN